MLSMEDATSDASVLFIGIDCSCYYNMNSTFC